MWPRLLLSCTAVLVVEPVVTLSSGSGGLGRTRREVFAIDKKVIGSIAFFSLASNSKEANAARSQEVSEALNLFNKGDFEASLGRWQALTEKEPENELFWSNRGTVELILGSSKAIAGKRPTGEGERLLLSAVQCFERAEDLGATDYISINNLGNAFAGLCDWQAAGVAYERAANAALKIKASASVPSQNRALIAVQLNDFDDAERRVVALLRRDPNFLDAKALLAAIRFRKGDKDGAESSFATLCTPAIDSPTANLRPPTRGMGGSDWCVTYSDTEIVKGRWTPNAIAAYDDFLASRQRNARIVANANPFRS